MSNFLRYELSANNINELQEDSIDRLIKRAKGAHHCNLIMRINGQDEYYEIDWLKHLVKAIVTPSSASITDA